MLSTVRRRRFGSKRRLYASGFLVISGAALRLCEVDVGNIGRPTVAGSVVTCVLGTNQSELSLSLCPAGGATNGVVETDRGREVQFRADPRHGRQVELRRSTGLG